MTEENAEVQTQEPSEEPEAETPEAEKPEGGKPEGALEKPEETTDEQPVTSWSELVATQEWDPEWANNLEFEVKVDGAPAKAKLADLVKSYQIGQAAEKRLEEAKSKAKSMTSELAEKKQALEAQFAITARLIETAEKLIDQDVAAIDWNKLREEDPAEYAAKKAEVAERRDRIAALKQEAVQSYRPVAEANKQELEAALRQRLQSEHEALLEKLPEWRDPEKAQAEKVKLAEYLIGQGFAKEDVMSASDHRLILLARKAWLYDEGQSKVSTVAKKKVVKAHKVLKPGAATETKPKPRTREEIFYGVRH